MGPNDEHYLSVTASARDQMLNAKMETFPQERHELRGNELTDDGQHQYISFVANNAEGVWYLNFAPRWVIRWASAP